jgi:hypothetical protein
VGRRSRRVSDLIGVGLRSVRRLAGSRGRCLGSLQKFLWALVSHVCPNFPYQNAPLDASYQRSQRATFGTFLEFSRNQKESENSRVEPTIILMTVGIKPHHHGLPRLGRFLKIRMDQYAVFGQQSRLDDFVVPGDGQILRRFVHECLNEGQKILGIKR